MIEDEALRRAVIGVEKPVYWRGRQIGSITRYSDALLIALITARSPEKFR